MTMNKPEYIALCSCGAYTVTIEGQDYSMSEEAYEQRYEDLKPDQTSWGSCNHCVNHWGIDLCACGSGVSPNACKEGLDCCGQPYQRMPE